jgi:class 3 adenylate cyclase/tetratricopeptide (TPR) repeat protein
MRCTACGSENVADASFCGECAASLTSTVNCPSCGRANPPKQKFCNGCGQPVIRSADRAASIDPRAYTPKHLAEKILTSRSALEGERKQVTVLFADVKGSMDLAKQVDPEEWHKIMDRFFAILSDGVHRFEGTINQYTGDGIMALFGAPIAHEDHARRGCYAALHLKTELRRYAEELRRTRGLNFSVRMGLNSGEVVVGKIGDDLRMDYTAQGQTVGLAARIEQLAAAESAYLTELTAKLVSGFFQLRDLGLFELKGVSAPLRVYELEGASALRTRIEVARSRGFSRFVGRSDEMAILKAALSKAIAGKGQVVGVVADPGVGKSRLCMEFTDLCRSRGIAVFEAHGVSHGKAIPFLPILELFRGYFGITEQDSDQATREKIAGRYLLLDERLRDALPPVFEFLGVPDPEHPAPRIDPDARQRQLFAIVKRVVEAHSRREPGVVLLEDLHWFDPGSEGFLEVLVETTTTTRNLLVVNFRPEYRAGWMQKSYYQQIPLQPLTDESVGEMLQDLLGTDPSLSGLASAIRDRTGGNPFFIEEMVQTLVEDGSLVGGRGSYRLTRPVANLALPATVQAVLAARIDRLAEGEKEVLQTAAVIGKEVPEAILRQVSPISGDDLAAALRTLIGADFLYETALYPEVEYTFKHPLTQEVAYHTQLNDRRAGLHGSVARVLQGLYPDKLDERAAVIAHHVEQAGEVLDAARWHTRAAHWAGTHDPAAALQHWQRVRRLLAPMTDSQEAIGLALASHTQILNLFQLLGVSGEEAAIVFGEGETLASRAGDLRTLASLNSAYAGIRLAHGAEDHLDCAREAVRLADECGDLALRRVVRMHLARSLIFAGLLSEGLNCTEEGMERLAPDPTLGIDLLGYNPYTMLAALRADFLIHMGHTAEAVQWYEKAIQRAREENDIMMLGVAYADYSGFYDALLGDAQVALTHARQGVEFGEKGGNPFTRIFAYVHLGQAFLEVGSYAEAVSALEQAREIIRESHTALEMEPAAGVFLAEAYAYSGDPERALRTAEEAVAGARRRSAVVLPYARLALARVLLRTKGLSSRGAIEAALEEASRLARETEFKMLEPFVRIEHSELARLCGDLPARERELREAHRLFTEIGAPIRAAEVAKELAR